jgi:hypothetical protein
MCEGLSEKTFLVMTRRVGLLHNCEELVQHLNPACRAARLLPGLPVSRLLMSLSDRDVPLPKKDKLNRSTLLLCFFTLLAVLPNAIQDTFIDVSLGFATAFSIVALAMLEQLSRAAFAFVMVLLGLVVVFLCLGGYSLVRQYWLQRRRQRAPHKVHFSVVSSLGAGPNRLRQDSLKDSKAERMWLDTSFSLQVKDADAQDVQDHLYLDQMEEIEEEPVEMEDMDYETDQQDEPYPVDMDYDMAFLAPRTFYAEGQPDHAADHAAGSRLLYAAALAHARTSEGESLSLEVEDAGAQADHWYPVEMGDSFYAAPDHSEEQPDPDDMEYPVLEDRI